MDTRVCPVCHRQDTSRRGVCRRAWEGGPGHTGANGWMKLRVHVAECHPAWVREPWVQYQSRADKLAMKLLLRQRSEARIAQGLDW